MQNTVDFLNGIIWSPALIYLCLAAGLFYTVLTRFMQVRMFGEMIRLLKTGKGSDKGISSFQALAVSLSGRVGTGNIAGVAAAIGFGGPGAVFWMWVVAIFGAATAYIEATLAQIYKEVDNGEYRGGPAYYIEKAMGQTWYAVIFAIATILACGVLLPTVQSNAIGNAVVQTLGQGSMIDTAMGQLSSTKIITGVIIVTILGFIIFGGVKRIANFAQIVVPFMALAYVISACAIIALNISEVPRIFSLIIGDAFTPMAGFGAATAQQGLVQSFSIYIDTLFVCSATAFMILITGMFNVAGPNDTFLIQNVAASTEISSPAFTQMAIESVMPGIGNPFVAIALFFFSFTTLMAYYYIAESNVVYIRRFINIPGAIAVLKVALMLAVFYGTVKAATLAWGLGDIGVGILIIFFMGKPALKALKDYEEQRSRGVTEFTFDPDALGIKNAEFWRKKR